MDCKKVGKLIFDLRKERNMTQKEVAEAMNISDKTISKWEQNIKFFPTYLWLVTTMVNKQMEFKVAMKEEVLGYWDLLAPLYAVFHEDDKTMPLSITFKS